jgi:hypothetical protein
MEIIPSQRGKQVFMQDGFYYSTNKILKSSFGEFHYLRCSNRECKSRAKLEGNRVVVSCPHNHPPDEKTKDILNFRAALKHEASINPNKKTKLIFQEVCNK